MTDHPSALVSVPEPAGLSPVYTAAYDSIRKGAPGLSDDTCKVIARSINMKVLLAAAPAAPQAAGVGIREILRRQADDPSRYLNPNNATSDNVFVDHDPEARFIADDYSDRAPSREPEGGADWRAEYNRVEAIREAAEGQDRIARGTTDPIAKSDAETQAAAHWKRYEREVAKLNALATREEAPALENPDEPSAPENARDWPSEEAPAVTILITKAQRDAALSSGKKLNDWIGGILQCAVEEATAEPLDDPQQLEAPAEAGEALNAAEKGRLAAVIHMLEPVAENNETVRLYGKEVGVLLKALRAQPQAREDAQPVALTVWYGSMPESNGRQNWTATIRRVNPTDKWDQGFCFARSEYHDRVRYEADRMRWIIGELTEKPDILAYDADAHSGYVTPHPAPDALLVAVEALEPFAAEAQRIRAPQSAETIMDNVELWQCGSFNITRTRLTYGDLRKAVDALAALQAEQKGGAA